LLRGEISVGRYQAEQRAEGLGGLMGAGIVAGGAALAAMGLEGAGLAAMEIAAGDSLGAGGLTSLGAGGTALFRAVDGAELADIAKNGFRLGPNGAEVKAFVANEGGARRLADTYANATGQPYSVVGAEASESVMKNAERYTFTDVPGQAMEAVAIRGDDVKELKFSTCRATRLEVDC
jgi:hypothetical protein